MSPLAAATPLADVTEREWQAQVVELLRTLGWGRVYHTHDSRRSAHGFPDLVCVRERVLYLELKRERGKLSDQQCEWLRKLLDGGAEAYVARPRHLEPLALILACRGQPWLSRGPVVEASIRLLEETRKESTA